MSGPATVDLLGWYLTYSANDLKKWKFPSTTMAANTYRVVFASGKNRAVAGGQLHTSFSLGSAGEYLALIKPDGVTVATEFSPQFPEQLADVSYGDLNGTNYYFSKPTPGSPNSGGSIALVSDTKFSQNRGFYDL